MSLIMLSMLSIPYIDRCIQLLKLQAAIFKIIIAIIMDVCFLIIITFKKVYNHHGRDCDNLLICQNNIIYGYIIHVRSEKLTTN